eukprot:CAMPEP_0119109384 /NCGR_PEP_ID=MMETSP1180-20130426/17881_1 /TAXON_ID=3052 ORGANISM="Chlamydomonas cf sp, Strain CCMP681" /NCGR_SAMPLE_ID=MMETSP1180 /ASSEMBLY_ACC=CAM_ASM_000741 /LENGTH=116 /DNA_ID=CAMNT_0007095137 /DNA_START=66 /DNA_END=416 /DNA_ORIENTATION=+
MPAGIMMTDSYSAHSKPPQLAHGRRRRHQSAQPNWGPVLLLVGAAAGAWYWWNKKQNRRGRRAQKKSGDAAGAVSHQFDGNAQQWVNQKTTFESSKGKVIMKTVTAGPPKPRPKGR